MATIIPIWDGSASPIVPGSGSTPFGFYDDDADFCAEAPKFADFAARRLGYPLLDVELQSGSFYAVFEEAVNEYSHQLNQFNIRNNLFNLQGASTTVELTGKVITPNFGTVVRLSKQYGSEAGVGGDVQYRSASIDLKDGQQRYDLNALIRDIKHPSESIEIKRVYHNATPAIARYFDPFLGTGLGIQTMMDTFGWGSYSPGVSFTLTPAYHDILRLQAIEFNDMIRKSLFSFEIVDNQFKVFPIPKQDYKLWFDYIVVSERSDPQAASGISDYSNVPYSHVTYANVNSVGRQWIYQYALALAKETLGWVRNKYSNVPIPNAEVTLNGDALISSAATDKQALIEQLRATLEELGRDKMAERAKLEAEYVADQLNRAPLLIYVG